MKPQKEAVNNDSPYQPENDRTLKAVAVIPFYWHSRQPNRQRCILSPHRHTPKKDDFGGHTAQNDV
ncbi:MAG: hypothetical protein E7199_00065 [Schwartzia succinivorans]|nr:hypothetical protein [Schwartzia succinivorans]